MRDPSATPEALPGHTYWRCRTMKHLWVEKADAVCCCNPGFSRSLVSRGDAVGMSHSKSAVDGFVWVWLPVGQP